MTILLQGVRYSPLDLSVTNRIVVPSGAKRSGGTCGLSRYSPTELLFTPIDGFLHSNSERVPHVRTSVRGSVMTGRSPNQRSVFSSIGQAAFLRLLTLRRSAALGDLLLACCARLPPREICFLRAVSRETALLPFRLAGFLRQLPSSCSLLPGTGSYPGQQREDFV
jgi:hypothetical protein